MVMRITVLSRKHHVTSLLQANEQCANLPPRLLRLAKLLHPLTSAVNFLGPYKMNAISRALKNGINP
jgi:hypothetical protein